MIACSWWQDVTWHDDQNWLPTVCADASPYSSWLDRVPRN
jgi:hypothetical protein